jgi:hypothetical protein
VPCYLYFFLFIKEATRLALVSGDQATYAKSIRIMGDIYRKKSEINVSIIVDIKKWLRNILLDLLKAHDNCTVVLSIYAGYLSIIKHI